MAPKLENTLREFSMYKIKVHLNLKDNEKEKKVLSLFKNKSFLFVVKFWI